MLPISHAFHFLKNKGQVSVNGSLTYLRSQNTSFKMLLKTSSKHEIVSMLTSMYMFMYGIYVHSWIKLAKKRTEGQELVFK